MWEDEVFTPQRNWKQKLVGDILFRGRRCEAVVVSKLQNILSHFGVGSCDKLRITIIGIKIVRILLSVV